jgi:hypothetical protein
MYAEAGLDRAGIVATVLKALGTDIAALPPAAALSDKL